MGAAQLPTTQPANYQTNNIQINVIYTLQLREYGYWRQHLEHYKPSTDIK
jgi:hypothetical protein